MVGPPFVFGRWALRSSRFRKVFRGCVEGFYLLLLRMAGLFGRVFLVESFALKSLNLVLEFGWGFYRLLWVRCWGLFW